MALKSFQCVTNIWLATNFKCTRTQIYILRQVQGICIYCLIKAFFISVTY